MGCSSSTAGSRPVTPDTLPDDLPLELRALPPFFLEILAAACARERELGGRKRFPRGYPTLNDKVKREEFLASYTDFEYIFLTVVGFARLHEQLEVITSQMNGESYTKNPGVQLLEQLCGMTMHGDREGSQAMLRQGPETLMKAFAIAKCRNKGIPQFFKEAFDRTADPCLEGRLGRIMAYLEARAGNQGLTSVDTPPWEDVSLRNLGDKATPQEVVGDYLRVFMAECTWGWSREQKLNYEVAKDARSAPAHRDSFSKTFNAATFEASMWSRGAVHEGKRWEHMTDRGDWVPYGASEGLRIETFFQEGRSAVDMIIGSKGWTYEIDFQKQLQRNRKTGKDRPIRRASVEAAGDVPKGKVTAAQLEDAIKYFVDLATLPEAASSGVAVAGSRSPATPVTHATTSSSGGSTAPFLLSGAESIAGPPNR